MSLKKQKTTSHLQRSRKKSQQHYGKKQVLSLSFPVFPNPWTEPTPLRLTTSPKQIPPQKNDKFPKFLLLLNTKNSQKCTPPKKKNDNHLPEHSCKMASWIIGRRGESSLPSIQTHSPTAYGFLWFLSQVADQPTTEKPNKTPSDNRSFDPIHRYTFKESTDQTFRAIDLSLWRWANAWKLEGGRCVGSENGCPPKKMIWIKHLCSQNMQKNHIVLTNHTLGTAYSAAISNENSHPWSPPQRDFIPRKKIIAMVLMACSSLRYKSGCTCWFDLTERGKERGKERGIVSRVDCLSLLLSPRWFFSWNLQANLRPRRQFNHQQFCGNKSSQTNQQGNLDKKYGHMAFLQLHRWTSHRPPATWIWEIQ